MANSKDIKSGSENPELHFRQITETDPRLDEVRELYEASFPPNERQPFGELFSGFYGEMETLAAFEKDRLVGIVMLLSHEEITHILYFAVEPGLRSRGYGSRMLKLIRDRYPVQKIIADIERPGENIPNESQRENRIAFYLNNGYRFTEIEYRWEGEDYSIMSHGGDVTWDAFRRFWQYYYSNGQIVRPEAG